MARSRPWRGLLVLASSTFLGCFAYVPAEPAAVPEGAEVRVHLTRAGVAALPELPDEAESVVYGRLVRSDAERLVVRRPLGERLDPLAARAPAQDFTIPRSDVMSLERRELSRGRTALVVAGAAALVALVVQGFGDGGPEGGGLPREPPVEGIRLPLISVPDR